MIHFTFPLIVTNHMQKGNVYIFSILESSILFPFTHYLFVCSPCSFFPSFFGQLTKLHQLAMQQNPFPIAHSNQGFQGRWPDSKRRCSCGAFMSSIVFSLDVFSWDGCLCTNWLSWADHSKWRKSHSSRLSSFTVDERYTFLRS